MLERAELLERLAGVQLLALDFDGILTDGFVYFDQAGGESVRCSRRDSLGTNMLQVAGLLVVVISKETNPVVGTRCKKMGVDYYQGVDTGEQKLDVLERCLCDHKILLSDTVYMGDDINDLPCLSRVSVAVTVADGHNRCKEVAHYVTSRKGGDHAVREICDLILKAKGGMEL